MQAAGLDLVTGYLPNQPLSDAAGQALRPMGPALMTHPHVTPERSPSWTPKFREAVHLPRITYSVCAANQEAGRTGRGVDTAAPGQPPPGSPGVVCPPASCPLTGGPQADLDQVALTDGEPRLLLMCLWDGWGTQAGSDRCHDRGQRARGRRSKASPEVHLDL